MITTAQILSAARQRVGVTQVKRGGNDLVNADIIDSIAEVTKDNPSGCFSALNCLHLATHSFDLREFSKNKSLTQLHDAFDAAIALAKAAEEEGV